MAIKHSIAEARSKLADLIKQAELGKAVNLTRRGRLVAVLLGRREYDRLTSEQDGFSAGYERFRKRFNLRELAIDPEEIFAAEQEAARARRASR